MYLRPTKIFRLDGKVVRPRRHFLIEVTKEEARALRRACKASVWRRTVVPKDWTVLKSNEVKNAKKNNVSGSNAGSTIKPVRTVQRQVKRKDVKSKR